MATGGQSRGDGTAGGWRLVVATVTRDYGSGVAEDAAPETGPGGAEVAMETVLPFIYHQDNDHGGTEDG